MAKNAGGGGVRQRPEDHTSPPGLRKKGPLLQKRIKEIKETLFVKTKTGGRTLSGGVGRRGGGGGGGKGGGGGGVWFGGVGGGVGGGACWPACWWVRGGGGGGGRVLGGGGVSFGLREMTQPGPCKKQKGTQRKRISCIRGNSEKGRDIEFAEGRQP